MSIFTICLPLRTQLALISWGISGVVGAYKGAPWLGRVVCLWLFGI